MKLLLASAAVAALIAAAPSAFADPPNQHDRGKTSEEHHRGATDTNGGIRAGAKTWMNEHGTAKTSTSSDASGNATSHTDGDDRGKHRSVTATTSVHVDTGVSGDGRRDNGRNEHGANRRNNSGQDGRGHSHGNFNRRNVTARHHYHYRGGSWHWPNGYHYQHWSFGMTLPPIFWTNDYWIDSYADYGLAPPPPGCVWVRYGDDAILIDRYSGEILEVVYGQFD